MESLLKVHLLTGEVRTVKVHDGDTMQDVIDLVVSKFRVTKAINRQFFALQISRTIGDNKTAHWIPNNYTLPDINQRYPSDEDCVWTFVLMVRFLPNNIQHLADTDITTFNYFYEQVRADFFSSIASQMETEVALQLGCLEMRRHFKDLSPQALNKKSNLNMLENDIGFSTFFPPIVLNSAKKKDVRKAIQTNFKQYTNLTENQCVYKFFEILSKTRQIFTSVYNLCIGDIGDNAPLVLNVGPLHGISYKQGETLVRIDFAGIRAITVEPTCTYQTRVIIIYTLAGLDCEQLDVIAPSLSTALELASLVDGYCIINTNIKESRITPDSEGAPRSARKVLAPSRAQSMYNRHSFNGPIPPSLPPERGSTIPNDVQRRSCFDIVPSLAPTFIEEEPDYALADNDWFIESSSIELSGDKPIGEGQFGAVFRGILHYESGDPSQIAIKTLKAESTNEERDKFLNEAYTMKKFNHPHIIELLGVVIDKQPPWIVMELAEHGELRGYLMKNSLATSVLLQFTVQVCSALDYLETSCKIVHRDVAARNVLVFSESVVKLADFGLSRYVEEEGYYKASKGRLPIKWMAPESINFRRFTSSSDVWMFGVCIWELFMMGIKPFRGIKNSEVISRIEMGERLAMPELMPPPLYSIIMQCWDYEPSARPKFSELMISIQSLIDEEYTSGKAPPTKPPRPARFPEQPEEKFNPQLQNEERERQVLEHQLEQQRAQSRADDQWLRESDSRHVSMSYPSTPAPSVPSKPLPKLDIDRNTDTVYMALTSLIQKIMEMSKIIDRVRADDFQQLVQTVGKSLRALLSAADAETARLATTQVNCEPVNMAKQVLVTDMRDVITSMQEAKQLSATTLDQEYRRKLLSRVHALAKDGKSLLEAVDMARALSTLYSPSPLVTQDGFISGFTSPADNQRFSNPGPSLDERARPHSYSDRAREQLIIDNTRPHSYSETPNLIIDNALHATTRLRTDPYSSNEMMVRRTSAPEGAPS